MKFSKSAAEVFLPSPGPISDALAGVTHLAIGAHQDDLEFMAFHGIVQCFGKNDLSFGGVTCTDGAGSSRSGAYANWTDDEMAARRRDEQKAAARVGRYGAMIQLGYSSAEARDRKDPRLRTDLRSILEAVRPAVVYTHNLADKHPTHVAVALAVIAALRDMPREARPAVVIGCEGWRDLDWLPDIDKVVMDVSGHEALAAALAGCFASQIGGGKRYDLAVAGRRAAHATFLDPHRADGARQVILGMDLAPLVREDSLEPAAYAAALIGRFAAEVENSLRGPDQARPATASLTES